MFRNVADCGNLRIVADRFREVAFLHKYRIMMPNFYADMRVHYHFILRGIRRITLCN